MKLLTIFFNWILIDGSQYRVVMVIGHMVTIRGLLTCNITMEIELTNSRGQTDPD